MSQDSPRSRKGPPVSRGGEQPLGEDEEVNQGTMRRSSAGVSRGTGEVENDPERAIGTNARPALEGQPRRRRKPSIVERGGRSVANDPERNHKTSTKVPLPGQSREVSKAQPPESSEAEWEAPPGKMSREMRPDRGDEGPYPSDDEEVSDYKTGNDYEQMGGDADDEVSIEGRSLEGDGLDALDPELDEVAHSKTRNLPANYDGSDDESGDESADDGNQTHAGPPLKLEIVGGPDSGKKKKFRGVRMVIGRTPGVDLQLTDQSVSRRHVELIAGDGGVMLRDLGSGNGSKVNGEKVTEKVLVHGDEIHIGKTKIRFVDEVGAFKKARDEAEKKETEAKPAEGAEAAAAEGEKPAEEGAEAKVEGEGAAEEGGEPKPEGEGEAGAEPKEGEAAEGAEGDRPKRSRVMTARNKDEAPGLLKDPKKRLFVIGGVVVLLLIVIVIAATRPKPPPPPDPNKTIAAEKMQLARDAVRSEKYEEAIKLIEEAEKLVPGIDQTRLATQARSELGVVSALDEVRRLIEAKKFEDAKAALAKAPQGSVKTEEAKKKLSDELVEAEAAYRKERFQNLLAEGDLVAAEQALRELTPTDQQEMSPVLDEAKAAKVELDKQQQRNAAEGSRRQGERLKQQKAEQMALAFAVVARKFTGQEWTRAAAECDRVVDQNPGDDEVRRKAKQLQQLIPTFGRNFEDGMKKYRANQLVAAAKPLKKAYDLYQQIGFQTSLGEELKEVLAKAALFSGKEALLREDLATAAIYFKDAARLDPDEPKARELLQEVISRADELYQSAYMVRDRDPVEALRKFKTVVEITPPGSTTHEKAKNQIAAMQP
ncbi:MAG: FHA domain-containing protein [Myxococcaceae bacterium]|nr:FHA domain-containing protein [Myxococcaceae bacterium]